MDDWEATLRDELALVGAGTQVDSGVGDHVRLTLSNEAFRYAAAPLSEVEVFRLTSEQVAFSFLGRRAVLDGELLLRLTAVSLVPPQPSEETARPVLLELQSVIVLVLDAPDRRVTYTASASDVTIRAPLSFVNTAGQPTLMIDLANALVDTVEFDASSLPSGFADVPDEVARTLAGTLVRSALSAAPDALPVFAMPPIRLGWADLTLAPSSLTVAGDAAYVSLGVVSNLRPRGALPPVAAGARLGGDALPEFSYEINADLWRAALLHLHVLGRLPRRFDGAGEADLEGAYGVVVREATLVGESARLRLTGFCTSGACSVDDYASTGSVALGEEGVALELVPVGSGNGLVPAFLPPTVAAGRDLGRVLLNPPPLALQASRELALEISDMDLRSDRIQLRGLAVLRDSETY